MSYLLDDDSLYLQVGDKIPSVEVDEGAPGKKVNVKELFAGKKGVLFAVPGAFTPGCSEVRKLSLLLSLILEVKLVEN